jgi:hypothetical protein
MTSNGEKFGKWQGQPPATPITVKAKDGYVVSGMTIHTALAIHGFTLTFARLGKKGIDLDDTYNGKPVGGEGDHHRLETIGGKGALFIGIVGCLNRPERSPCALGLVSALPKN